LDLGLGQRQLVVQRPLAALLIGLLLLPALLPQEDLLHDPPLRLDLQPPPHLLLRRLGLHLLLDLGRDGLLHPLLRRRQECRLLSGDAVSLGLGASLAI